MQRNLRAKHQHDAGGGQAEGSAGDQEEGGVVVGEEPPAVTLTAPVHLTAQPTGHTGELSARWSAVPNKRFYEVQAMPVGETPVSAAWDELPTHPISRRQIDLKGFTPGSLVSLRVRAVGAKGAGPWCDPLTARV